MDAFVKEPTQPITGWPAPLRIEFIQSPHYNERPSDARIWTIVIHATANDSLEGVIRWFTNPTSLVSAHYNIGKDGRIVQMAREDQEDRRRAESGPEAPHRQESGAAPHARRHGFSAIFGPRPRLVRSLHHAPGHGFTSCSTGVSY